MIFGRISSPRCLLNHDAGHCSGSDFQIRITSVNRPGDTGHHHGPQAMVLGEEIEKHAERSPI